MRLYRETSRAPSMLSIMTMFPASATAEGAQFNGTPFPASATAEGAQFNVPPSLATLLGMTCYTGSGCVYAVSRQRFTQ